MPGLPFLRLPAIPQLKILKNVDTFELVSLSFCSKKAKNVVKSVNFKLDSLSIRFTVNDNGKREMTITVNDECVIQFEETASIWKSVFLQNLRHGVSIGEPVHLFYEWVEPKIVNRAIKHVLDTFTRVARLQIEVCNKMVKEWISPESKKALEAKFRSTKMRIEDEMFENGRLEIRGQHTQLVPVEKEELNNYYVHGPFWVNFDAILNSNSRSISIRQALKPCASQLGMILEQWIAKEKLVNLESFSVTLLPSSYVSFNQRYPFKVLAGIRFVRIARDFYRIRRVDKKKAEVQFTEGQFLLRVLH